MVINKNDFLNNSEARADFLKKFVEENKADKVPSAKINGVLKDINSMITKAIVNKKRRKLS